MKRKQQTLKKRSYSIRLAISVIRLSLFFLFLSGTKAQATDMLMHNTYEQTHFQNQEKKRTIHGVVTDETNTPLPGVAIKVKNTHTGVATDIAGRYELLIEDNPDIVLQFSFVGMRSHEEKVGDRHLINLKMTPISTDLEEVMVVAYGTVKKEAFTGSAVSVKGDQVIKAAASKISPERALQGNVAGVRFSRGDGQPGGSASIQIRGIGSINEQTDPLFVVDGVTTSSGLSMLNPDDIESMTVLKDAAATSLYGSRASNGVIVITTKKGKAGKVKFDVTYERAWSFQTMPRGLDGYYMNGKELTEYSLEALKNKYLYDREALPWQNNYQSNNTALQEQAYQYALSRLHEDAGIIHPDDPLDGSFDYNTADLSRYVSHPRSYNWYDAIFQNGSENKFNLTARGGNEISQYYASLGYVNQKGIAKGSEFERYTGRLSLNSKPSKYIQFSLGESIGFSIWDQNSEGDYASNPVTGMRRLNPTQPVYFPNGELNPTPGFRPNIPNYIRNLDLVLYNSRQFSSISNLNVTVSFTDWLNFKTIAGIDINYSENKTTWTPESNDGAGTNGQVSQSSSIWLNLVTSNTLNFNRSFGSHNLAALAGYEAKKYTSRGLSAEGQNFTTAKLMYLANAAVPSDVGGSESTDRLISWIFKADYNYDNKYFLSGSYRRDGTSRLLSNNRWGNFWSVSGAWNITQEEFMTGTSTWLDNLKIKLSYGTNGNQPSSYFRSQNLYYVNAKHNMNPATQIAVYGNPKLSWENSYTWNAGVDFSLWGNRLKGTIEYYNRHTKDLIDQAKTPIMSGWSSITVNEGELRNTGLEITLDSRNIVSEGFTWTTSFNISYMRAMVEKLKDDKISHPYITKQGEKLNSFYTREWVGVDPATGQGTWKLNTKNAAGDIIDPSGTTHNVFEADRKIVGQGYPDWFGGMTNTFSYKGIELSFLLTFTLGGDLWDGDHYSVVPDGNGIGTGNFRKEAAYHYWKQAGDKARDPIIIYNNPLQSSENTSTRRLMSSDHLRVKTLTLAYNLPKYWLKPIGLSAAKIYLNGNDILTFSKSDYINPEVNMSGMAKSVNSWPSLKSWRVGINIQF